MTIAELEKEILRLKGAETDTETETEKDDLMDERGNSIEDTALADTTVENDNPKEPTIDTEQQKLSIDVEDVKENTLQMQYKGLEKMVSDLKTINASLSQRVTDLETKILSFENATDVINDIERENFNDIVNNI